MKDELFFIDTNIVMYAAGKEHQHKNPCASIILGIASGSFQNDFGIPITDTEVFQEILYRYALLGRWKRGISLSKDFLALGLKVLTISSNEVVKMIELAEVYQDKGVAPRDLVHVAVMINHGIRNIISVDSHFDLIAEVVRIDPRNLV
jgi:hypothetical protein